MAAKDFEVCSVRLGFEESFHWWDLCIAMDSRLVIQIKEFSCFRPEEVRTVTRMEVESDSLLRGTVVSLSNCILFVLRMCRPLKMDPFLFTKFWKFSMLANKLSSTITLNYLHMSVTLLFQFHNSNNNIISSIILVTNSVSFVFYSIWCHLITLLLWLTTAPSFPSSLLFCCIFPLYYFPLSCFSWWLFCSVLIWFCPCFPQSKHWFNAPFISVTPPSQLCFLCSCILSLVQMFPLFLL